MTGTIIVKAVTATPIPSGPTIAPGTLPPGFRSPSNEPSPSETIAPSPSGQPEPASGASSSDWLVPVVLLIGALILGWIVWARLRTR